MPGPRIDPLIPPVVGMPRAAEILGIGTSQMDRIIKAGDLEVQQVEGSGAWIARREAVLALKTKRDSRQQLRKQSGQAEDDGAE